MKNNILLVGMIMTLIPSIAWATPPESLDVQYNSEKKLLTVSGRHPTQDRLEHFIRRFRVTVNQDEPHTTYLTRQNSASEFQADIPLDAKPGDAIKVEVFCNQGGGKESVLHVPPQAALNEVKPVDHAQQLKDLKDKDHETVPVVP